MTYLIRSECFNSGQNNSAKICLLHPDLWKKYKKYGKAPHIVEGCNGQCDQIGQFLESCQNHSFFSEIIFGHFLQTFVRFLFGHTGNGTPSISLKTRGKRSYVQKLLMLIDWLTQSLEIYLTLSRAKSSFDLDPKRIT